MELANFIVEDVLKQAVTDKIVVYGGRFQPFHKGHKKVYDALVSKFGSKNVYIATSDVQDGDKSPLSFSDKKEIATKLFGIPSSKFVKVKQPYQPVEILRGYDDTTTALIVAVGEKDDARLGGNYFKPYTNDKNLKGYAVNAYVYSALPSNSFGATDVRNMFRNNRMGGERKQKEFEKFFGKFDKAIYTKLITKLNEGVDTDNKIPGGLADDKTLVDIAKKWAGDYYDYKNVLETVKQELKRGIKIELEHTSDIKIAAEIAKDHIEEKLTYYKDLQQIEKGMYQPHNPIKEASAAGSGYDEKTLDQLVDNPETGEKVKVRSALNYDKNHPAYRAAMAIVGKSGTKQPNQQQRTATKPQQPQNRNAGGPMTGTNNRVGAKPTPGANNQNGTNSTNKTQKPLEKPLTNPAQAQEKPQQSQQQQNVSVDKVKKDIPNFNVSDKSDIGKISVKQRRDVSMKIDDLAKKSAEAKANGEKAPNFNLCDITIPGTNLYCGGNKGIPRDAMPQAKGDVVKGSKAEKLLAKQNAERVKNGEEATDEVDGTKEFLTHLKKAGISASKPKRVRSDKLSATQQDMNGEKVGGMMTSKDYDPSAEPIFVSRDGYVVDGHHRWAATVGKDAEDGKLGNNHKMNVIELDAPISQILKEANAWTDSFGIKRKKVGK